MIIYHTSRHFMAILTKTNKKACLIFINTDLFFCFIRSSIEDWNEKPVRKLLKVNLRKYTDNITQVLSFKWLSISMYSISSLLLLNDTKRKVIDAYIKKRPSSQSLAWSVIGPYVWRCSRIWQMLSRYWFTHCVHVVISQYFQALFGKCMFIKR